MATEYQSDPPEQPWDSIYTAGTQSGRVQLYGAEYETGGGALCWRLQCSVCSLVPLAWEMDLLTTSLLQDDIPPASITESVASFTKKLKTTVFEADKQIDT